MTDNTDTDKKIITIKFSVSPSELLPEKMTLCPPYSDIALKLCYAQDLAEVLEEAETSAAPRAHQG